MDDLRENCEGAEAVGMTAVLHRGAETTLPELERLLVEGFRDSASRSAASARRITTSAASATEWVRRRQSSVNPRGGCRRGPRHKAPSTGLPNSTA